MLESVLIKHSFAVAYSDMWDIYELRQNCKNKQNNCWSHMIWYDMIYDKEARAKCSFNEFLMKHFKCTSERFQQQHV